jgi:hypothetical protein
MNLSREAAAALVSAAAATRLTCSFRSCSVGLRPRLYAVAASRLRRATLVLTLRVVIFRQAFN